MKIFLASLILFSSSGQSGWAQQATPESSPTPSSVETPPTTVAPEANSPASEQVNPEAAQKPASPPVVDGFQLLPGFMRVAPEQNGFKALNPQLNYEVTKDGSIKVSGVTIDDANFKVFVGSKKRLVESKTPVPGANKLVVYASFPYELGQKGQIEILGEKGETLLVKTLGDEDYAEGKSLSEKLKAIYANSKPTAHNVLFSAPELKAAIFSPQKRNDFRFCWKKEENENDDFFMRICSPYYRYSSKEKDIKVQTQVGDNQVFIDNQETKIKDSKELQINQSIRFLASGKTRFTFEFHGKVLPLLVTDFYHDQAKDMLYLVGHSSTPASFQTKEFPVVKKGSLTDLLRFDPTIGDLKTYWITELPSSSSSLILPGEGGGLFIYPFEIDKALSIEKRVRLHDPLKSTYSENVVLKGSVSDGVEISTEPAERLEFITPGREFKWKFPAIAKDSEQEGTLTIKDKGDEFKLNYSIYRGYSSDVSFRMGSVITGDWRLILLDEVTYGQWFENLFGWENRTFSHQRWGIFARYIDLLKADSKLSGTADAKNNRRLNFNLKYRFTPGLWERDETVGLLFGLEDVSIAFVKGNFAGGGLFWARSMPKIFDDIFNIVPIMRYPKWVDMEFLFYPFPLSSQILKGKSYNAALNFHGKVAWTKTLFGEMGFGLISYNYQTDIKQVKFNAFYGTVGMGYKF